MRPGGRLLGGLGVAFLGSIVVLHSISHLRQPHALLSQSAKLSSGTAATAQNFRCLVESQAFNHLVQTCCRSIVVPPSAQSLLPMDLSLGPQQHPAAAGYPVGTRFRYLLGNRNDLVFSGATEETIAFINHYFGYDLKQMKVSSDFRRRQHAEVRGDPDLANKELTGMDDSILNGMPGTLTSEGVTAAVDVSSLPSGATILYSNAPHAPAGSPGFVIKYCESSDPSGTLNQGLPMKVDPKSCAAAESLSMQCTCGRIIFLGWHNPTHTTNLWPSGVVNLAQAAAQATCGGVDLAPAPAPPPPAPLVSQAADTDPCSEHPDYDPAAQMWYYLTPAPGGGEVKMVRHWCKSEFGPQEAWYKYQRYVPRTKNNFPAPPINDFDFLNSFARDSYRESQAERNRIASQGRFDDSNLGSSLAKDSYDRTQEERARIANSGRFDDNQLGNSAAAARARR